MRCKQKIIDFIKKEIKNSLNDENNKTENPQTRILNNSFNSGRYYALMDVLEILDRDEYMNQVKETNDDRHNLTRECEKIYK